MRFFMRGLAQGPVTELIGIARGTCVTYVSYLSPIIISKPPLFTRRLVPFYPVTPTARIDLTGL